MLLLTIVSLCVSLGTAARNGQPDRGDGGQMPEPHISPMNQDLERNVVSAAGGDLNTGSFVEYWYVDKRNQLFRKDFDKARAEKMLSNVRFVDNAFDSSVWYIGTDGQPYRLTPDKETGELVPGVPRGTTFTRLSPRSVDEALLVASNGQLYHYAMKEFVPVDGATNAKDAAMGNDGLLMYATRNGQLFRWSWASSSWEGYERKGHGVAANDFEHIVIVDAQGKTKKRVDGRWRNVKDRCDDVAVYSPTEFLCVTPEGALRNCSIRRQTVDTDRHVLNNRCAGLFCRHHILYNCRCWHLLVVDGCRVLIKN
ncbi:uncharacterized protein LOC129582270 [Paramacrobiotus metropolitanus]|uniref:uncharacterized protein LOC129582270 n=1 Tax=Paramacrobiotus metropolitanus TaxID=2943436 RepID=UPI002445C9E4|nr:uncharacterized protein LOC129582270 [Paramacrobiotus metropolitanus]